MDMIKFQPPIIIDLIVPDDSYTANINTTSDINSVLFTRISTIRQKYRKITNTKLMKINYQWQSNQINTIPSST